MRSGHVSGHAQIFASALASLALCWSAPALAGGETFQPDSVPIWSARTTALGSIAFDNDPAGRDTGDTMLAACKGLQGEQMSHEYGKVPSWALKGQLYICEAYKGWAKHKPGSGECKLLQQGLDFLGHANPATDPAEVVKAVALATSTGNTLLSAMRSRKHAC